MNPPVLTIIEHSTNHVLVLAFEDEPPNQAYIIGFYLNYESAFNAAYAYLHAPPYTRPKHSFRMADPTPPRPHINIALSDEAHAYFVEQTRLYKYNGRTSYLGIAVYLQALIDANPLPTDWTDNRHNIEPDLLDYNVARLEAAKLPRWNDDDFTPRLPLQRRRTVRTFPRLKLEKILAQLEPISLHHSITPHRDIQDFHLPTRWAAAALEAIGLKYLIPRNHPRVNPTPAKYDRRHHRNAAKADQKFPFF